MGALLILIAMFLGPFIIAIIGIVLTFIGAAGYGIMEFILRLFGKSFEDKK